MIKNSFNEKLLEDETPAKENIGKDSINPNINFRRNTVFN